MAVDLSNVLKLHLFIFKTSMKTGVRLQALQMSEAVQKIETKDTDQNYLTVGNVACACRLAFLLTQSGKIF